MLKMQRLGEEARGWTPMPAIPNGRSGSVADFRQDSSRDIYLFDCLMDISVVGIVRDATIDEYANVRSIDLNRVELLRVLQREGDSYQFTARVTPISKPMKMRVMHTEQEPQRVGAALSPDERVLF